MEGALMRKRTPLLVVALVGAATVVRTTAPPAATEQGGAAGAAVPNVAHGMAACIGSLQGHVALTASAVARLEAICARTRSGDPAVRDEARKEACVELVNNLQIPPGPARAHALAICRAP